MTLEKAFLNEVDQLIKKTSLFIEDRKKKCDGIGTLNELQMVLNDLRKMRSEVLKNSLPNKGHRFVSYEKIVCEKWGVRNEYSKSLLDLATKYMSSLK